jgi:hypothetical protein
VVDECCGFQEQTSIGRLAPLRSPRKREPNRDDLYSERRGVAQQGKNPEFGTGVALCVI